MNASYLARLKSTQANLQKPLPSLPSKPSKAIPILTNAPFEPFEGSQGRGVFKNECRTVSPKPEQDDIAERAALAAGSVPAVYLDAWTRINRQAPPGVAEADWRRALDDGGRFLDAWGALAAEWGWTVGEVFDLPRAGQRGGLIWFISGEQVEAFGPDHARMSDERVFDRGTVGGERV